MRLFEACALLALVGGSGCDRPGAPPRPSDEPQHAPSARPSAVPSGPHPQVDAGASVPPLEPGIRRAMKLGPKRVHGTGVAIGKGRVGVLADDALVVRETSTFEVVVSIPMHAPRTLVTTVDGGLLAADNVHTVWLLAHDRKPQVFPPIVMLPGSAVFADRSTPQRFWVAAARGTTLFDYALASSSLPLLLPHDWVLLDGYDGRLLGSLRDGSFLYSTFGGFRRFYGRGRKEAVETQVPGAFRLLPASRVDTIWILTKDKALLYRVVADRLLELRSVPLSAMAFDADADGPYLAVLELSEPKDAPWTMTLEVFDEDGRRRLQEAFATTESLRPNEWVNALEKNRRLAIRDGETPLVAVGGPDELYVLRADNGARVFSSPGADAGAAAHAGRVPAAKVDDAVQIGPPVATGTVQSAPIGPPPAPQIGPPLAKTADKGTRIGAKPDGSVRSNPPPAAKPDGSVRSNPPPAAKPDGSARSKPPLAARSGDGARLKPSPPGEASAVTVDGGERVVPTPAASVDGGGARPVSPAAPRVEGSARTAPPVAASFDGGVRVAPSPAKSADAGSRVAPAPARNGDAGKSQ